MRLRCAHYLPSKAASIHVTPPHMVILLMLPLLKQLCFFSLCYCF